MKKFASLALASALATTSLSASDLLSKATGGAISDNSFGIKKLNNSQMSDVKGGYYTAVVSDNNTTFAMVLAIPDSKNELGVVFDSNGIFDYDASVAHDAGICKLGQSECYLDKNKEVHMQQSRNRLTEYIQALGGYVPSRYVLGYIVEKKIGITNRGTRYAYFQYATAAVNRDDGSIHRISSGLSVDTYGIVRELRDAFKKRLESSLGGL
ncbi:hypothetical protein [Campylobacter sp. 19-13652]|uniref:hypothetical protein n=1 Tax=Campylobacter sp. 19-13652 TaxID=2840180 RepID=UPI001C796653|nr:hypothetical protein [Campylobacter sp. 19-13652]BCX78642.1 hypothetical protein LBC_01040 [Campylobacter sp. 19-13652]